MESKVLWSPKPPPPDLTCPQCWITSKVKQCPLCLIECLPWVEACVRYVYGVKQ